MENAEQLLQEARADLFHGETPSKSDRRLVPIRDVSQPKVLELVLDADGEPELVDEKDAQGDPVLGDDGQPKKKTREEMRHPPKLYDGKPRFMEVRRPTISERNAIIKAAGLHKGASKVDLDQLLTEGIIRLTYLPGTEKRMFTAADRQAMLNKKAGSWVDELSEIVRQMMNVDEEGLKKSSAKTKSGSSSSP